jgi:hypothetical protein
MLTVTAVGRSVGLGVTVVVGTLHRIAGGRGPGSQGRKLGLLAGLLALWDAKACLSLRL